MPSNGYSMVKLNQNPIFVLKDSGDNIVTDNYQIMINVFNAPTGSSLTGDISLISNNGVADFSGNSFYFDKVGNYKIYASSNLPPANLLTIHSYF